jgi:Flp pilus assembly protein TadD/TolB-like protein
MQGSSFSILHWGICLGGEELEHQPTERFACQKAVEERFRETPVCGSVQYKWRRRKDMGGYNSVNVRRYIGILHFCCLLLVVYVAAPCLGQSGTHQQTQTVLVLPFENHSNAPGLDWIAEAFPEILGQRLALAHLYLITRDDRNYALDRLGIPTTLHLSRATLYKVAEQIDADYVVFGSYNYDGQNFTCAAQVLDMKALRLSPELKDSGPLLNLIEVQTKLSWRVLKTILPDTQGTGEQFFQSSNLIRLDAFENYIRGVIATDRTTRIRYLREALRLDPQYSQAMMVLAKTYFNHREYESAEAWFAKVPKLDPAAGEASFLLGLASYYTGDFDKADTAFRFVEARLPLTEVYNNLGVVASRRHKNAVNYFQKAVQQDPNDPDYRFNLGVALYRAGETAGAVRQLRQCLSLRPDDVEAKQFLDSIAGTSSAGLSQQNGNEPLATAPKSIGIKVPLERIKRNYDETSYRQLAMEVQNAMERSLAKADPKIHAEYHVQHGNELLAKGLLGDAEGEFREAILRDPTNSQAHSGLAQVAEANGNYDGARREANTALQLGPNAEAYVVLGRLELRDNRVEAAAQYVDRALALEPANSGAAALKREIEAKRSKP